MTSTHIYVDPDMKATIARVAAEYALYEGIDSVTPCAVADGAGVPLKVFHACFCSVGEALLDFFTTGVERLAQRAYHFSPDVSLLRKAEQIVIDSVREGEAEVYSLPSLMRLRKQIDIIDPNKVGATLGDLISNFGPEIRGRAGHLTEFEYTVQFRLLIEATETAMAWYYKDPDSADPEVGVEYVRAAFRMITP